MAATKRDLSDEELVRELLHRMGAQRIACGEWKRQLFVDGARVTIKAEIQPQVNYVDAGKHQRRALAVLEAYWINDSSKLCGQSTTRKTWGHNSSCSKPITCAVFYEYSLAEQFPWMRYTFTCAQHAKGHATVVGLPKHRLEDLRRRRERADLVRAAARRQRHRIFAIAAFVLVAKRGDYRVDELAAARDRRGGR